MYDIMCAKNYNPNERTNLVYARGIPFFLLAGRLQKAITAYYKDKSAATAASDAPVISDLPAPLPEKDQKQLVYQCPECFIVYDESIGDPSQDIAPNTRFSDLPNTYACFICETTAKKFLAVNKKQLAEIADEKPSFN